MSLKGKVAVVVGGEGPLGRAVTKKFLEESAKIVIGWNSQKDWDEAKALIPDKSKSDVIDVSLDATQEEQVEALMKKAKDTFGSIDILLHMVGFFTAGKLLWESDAALLEKLWQVNLKSAFLSSKHAVLHMLDKGKGRLFFFTAKDTIQPMGRFGVYSLSKCGLVTLAEALRAELKETSITANAIMISVMDTPGTRHMPNPQPDKWVKPAEVADLLSCLCSDEASALSGSTLKLFAKL